MKRIGPFVALLLAAVALTASSGNYRTIKTQQLDGPPSWDYLTVDDAARRLYVSHSTEVEVLDADTLSIIGTIPSTPGVHGIALAREFNRGFITAGKADSVVIFDLQTLKTIGQVKVGKKPDAIAYDPATKRVFAMNGDGESTTAINAADGTVAGTVPLGGGPEFAVSDGNGDLYVNLEDQTQLVRVDTRALHLKDRWPVVPCQAPSSLAFDPATRRLFLGCRSRVMAVVDADNGKVVTTYPIGDHVDASAFDPSSKLIFNSTGDGNLSIFHQNSADSYSLFETIPTLKGSKTMALDRKTGRVFIPANQDGKFAILILAQ